MSYKARYDKGDWKTICDACGRIFKATELRKRWDGFMVCEQDWEPRQPQDFVRGVADIQAPTWTRPENPNTFALTPAVAMLAIAGACVPNTIPGPGPVPSSTFTEP